MTISAMASKEVVVGESDVFVQMVLLDGGRVVIRLGSCKEAVDIMGKTIKIKMVVNVDGECWI